MADTITFGIKMDLNDESKTYLADTKDRLLKEDFIANPFKGQIVVKEKKASKDLLGIFDLKPIYPDLSIVGVLIAGTGFLIGGFSYHWSISVGIAWFLLAKFLWSKYFFYLMLSLGAKKSGYKGKINLLSSVDVVREVLSYAN